MAVEFRCEHCGELVSADGPAGQEVTCPYCENITVIPEGLASLPSPQIPGMDAEDEPAYEAPAPVDSDVDDADAEEEGDDDEFLDEDELEEGEPTEFMQFLAKCMPWLISIFIHAAVLLLLAALVLAVIYKADPAQAEVNSKLTEPPGAVVSPVQMQDVSPNVTPEPVKYSPTESTAVVDSASTDSTVQAIGRSGGNSSSGHPLGTGTGAGMGGGIFQGGGGGTIKNWIYVIDRSGSMHATFEDVRQELINTINGFEADMSYHVIIFATGDPLEKEPARLVERGDVGDPTVAAMSDFLYRIEPFGQTDPIPALKKAFLVARAAGEGGTAIELLTDGSFPDNRAVLKLIRERNLGGRVFVDTYLYGHRSREAEAVLQTIANENGGEYKYISPDEFQQN